MNIDKDKEPSAIEVEDAQDKSLVDVLVQEPQGTLVQNEEYFQVDAKKDSVIADQADFVKIFNQLQKKQREKKQIEAQRKKDCIKKKKALKKESLKAETSTQDSKNERILKAIDAHIKHYKATNNPNFSDTEVGKLRHECKQKIFKALMYGAEQLKQFKPNELMASQEKVARMLGKEMYAYCKSLTIEIDNELLDQLNSGNKQTSCKKYKSHLKTFSSNLGEQSNYQLRKKVLSKQLTPKLIGELAEQEFFPKHIRQKMIQKENFLLREATAPEKSLMPISDQDYMTQEIQVLQPEKPKDKQKKQKYPFIGELSLTMLRDLLNNNQIQKMKSLLTFDNRLDIEEKLQSNLCSVFKEQN